MSGDVSTGLTALLETLTAELKKLGVPVETATLDEEAPLLANARFLTQGRKTLTWGICLDLETESEVGVSLTLDRPGKESLAITMMETLGKYWAFTGPINELPRDLWHGRGDEFLEGVVLKKWIPWIHEKFNNKRR